MRPYGLRFRQREKTPRGAPPSLGPLCEGGCPQAVGERTVRRAGIFRAQTGENSCRGEHCSPVPACLTRQLSRKMRCGGKLAGDQWSPLHTQQGKTRPSPPAKKNVGADSISARARLRQDKPPRAHIECAPTDYVSDKGRKLRAGHRLCEGNAPLRISLSTSAMPVLGETTKKESVTS